MSLYFLQRVSSADSLEVKINNNNNKKLVMFFRDQKPDGALVLCAESVNV